ncbi:sugar transferase [Pseudokineococcus basanitobsidens]|uniref:Sugar transferase n=1 Tax=Pseudokineococcus basanitobsidens TaxID=1926649 RepID=A0ABU8RMI7_9ACTN
MSAEVGPRVGVPSQSDAPPVEASERRRHDAPTRRPWTDRRPFDAARVEGGDPVAAAARRRTAWTVPLLRRAVLGDAVVAAVVVACGLVSLRQVGRDLGPTAVVVGALVSAAAWVGVLAAMRAYEWRRVGDGPDEFSSILRAAVAVVAGLGVVSFGLELLLPRRMVLVAVPVVALLTAWHRYRLRGWLRARRRRGGAPALRTLVVGDGPSALDISDGLRRAPEHGMHVVGVAVPDPAGWESADGWPPCLGAVAEVPQTVVDHAVDVVIVVGSHLAGPSLRRLSWALEPTGADLVVAPGLVEVAGPAVHLRPAAGLSLLHVERPSSRSGRLLGKAVLDRTLGSLLLLAASPVLLGSALLVRITTRGPAFFAQQRVGVDGALFTMLKLRTMVVDADRQVDQLVGLSDRDGLMFKMRDDPRITPVGRWLRRFSLDELPQLWNVVRGDMSLVGPRPPLPREYVDYHDSVHLRMRVRPGLTGLWQVSGRADLSWEESMRLDLRYVDNWSLAMDALILWKTARAVVKSSGAY